MAKPKVIAAVAAALAIPPGHTPLHHPGGPLASCSSGGVSYTADAKGVVIVPEAAAADLLAHGFTVVDGEVGAAAAVEAEDDAGGEGGDDKGGADDKKDA